MNRNCFFSIVAAAAICGGSFFLSSQPAAAGGLIGDLVNGVYPGVGTAMDAWSREWQARDSDHSVMSQALGAHIPNTPFQAAQGPGSAPPPPVRPLIPYCATPAGTFGPLPPTAAPAGEVCWWSFPNGQTFNGQLAYL